MMNNTKNRILVLFAHPSQERSEVNVPLYRASQGLDGVTCVDLYAEYPDYRIDIDREQQRLREHEVIVFMFPLYWYSTPSILKEWQDLVLEYGFAYGAHGTVLNGKTFLCALTAGGAEKAYHAEGYNHFTIRELLRPLEQTALLTGMHYLPPYTLFESRTAADDNRISAHVNDWRQLLKSFSAGRVERDQVEHLNTLNENLNAVIGAVS